MQTLTNKYATLDKYILVKTLGTGYNSRVKLGFDPTSNTYFAVKIIKHSHPKLNLETLKKEITILSALKHPNVVNLIDFYDSVDYIKKNGKTYKVVAIVMELVPGGELFEYVADSGRFSEDVSRSYFRFLIETLEFCHNQGIAHRDLKPENLLFDAMFNLKVADFGFATLWAGKDGSGQLTTHLGTESYMAPELHARKAYSGPSVDLFASAIILFIMITGTPPFVKADPKTDPHYKLISNGRADIFWKAHERNKPKIPGRENFYSDEFRDLLTRMFAENPAERPTIEQIKNHAWYKGPVVDMKLLRAEFLQRKKLVDAEIKRQREAKKQEKLQAQMQQAMAGQSAMTGIKPFRSLIAEVEPILSAELEHKINFETKRELAEYRPEAGFRAYTEMFSVLSADFVFKALCVGCLGKLIDFTVSENTYKIKGKAQRDEGSCNITILLTKVDDATICIEFHKTSGNVMTFYKVIDDLKKKLPQIVCEDEKKEESVAVEGEAQ